MQSQWKFITKKQNSGQQINVFPDFVKGTFATQASFDRVLKK